jgi:hypothetical protein
VLFLVNTELGFPVFNHPITRFPGPRLSPRLCASVIGVRFSLSDPGDVALCRRSRRSQFSPLSSRAEREPLRGERAERDPENANCDDAATRHSLGNIGAEWPCGWRIRVTPARVPRAKRCKKKPIASRSRRALCVGLLLATELIPADRLRA